MKNVLIEKYKSSKLITSYFLTQVGFSLRTDEIFFSYKKQSFEIMILEEFLINENREIYINVFHKKYTGVSTFKMLNNRETIRRLKNIELLGDLFAKYYKP